MSIFIKGMEMPKTCSDCPLCYDFIECLLTGTRCVGNKFHQDFCETRFKDCPLVEIKKPHGRLVDSKLVENVVSMDTYNTLNNEERAMAIQDLPTVIIAEIK